MVSRIVFIALVAASVSACSKSPETICAKFEELEAKATEKDKTPTSKDDCIKEFTKMKEVSPEAFNCSGTCAGLSTKEDAMSCMMLCVLADPKIRAAEEEKSKKEAEAQAEKLTKLTELPMKSYNGTIKTYDDKKLDYSISLAEGFAEDTKLASDSMKNYELKVEGAFVSPSITIMPSIGGDLESDVKMAAELKEKVVKKEKLEKGHILTTEGEGMLKAEVVVVSGKTALSCKATIYGEKPVEKKDKFLPWLEKMCTSLTVK